MTAMQNMVAAIKRAKEEKKARETMEPSEVINMLDIVVVSVVVEMKQVLNCFLVRWPLSNTTASRPC
jgi:hypothetical protein